MPARLKERRGKGPRTTAKEPDMITFNATHLYRDQTPVMVRDLPAVLPLLEKGRGYVAVYLESLEEVTVDVTDLGALPEGQEEATHEAHQSDCAPCDQEESLRTTLARWAQAVDNSRKELVHGITKVMADSIHLSSVDRRTLERAMEKAMEELAKFRP